MPRIADVRARPSVRDPEHVKPHSSASTCPVAAYGISHSGPRDRGDRGANTMMQDHMSGMMWGMGLFGALGLAALVLVVAALIKFLLFR